MAFLLLESGTNTRWGRLPFHTLNASFNTKCAKLLKAKHGTPIYTHTHTHTIHTQTHTQTYSDCVCVCVCVCVCGVALASDGRACQQFCTVKNMTQLIFKNLCKNNYHLNLTRKTRATKAAFSSCGVFLQAFRKTRKTNSHTLSHN